METAVTESNTGNRAALGATTIAEAFRITAAERARRGRDPHQGRRLHDHLGGTARARRRARRRALPSSGSKRGDTLALMLSNRPEFHLCDLAAMMLGATPFSIYNTYTAEQIAYLVSDADARILICEQQYLPQVLEARKELPGPRARDRRRRRGARGHARAVRRRGLEPRLRRRGRGRADPADRRADADLHLGHDRAAEGRAADPPQPARGRRGPRGADRASRRTAA